MNEKKLNTLKRIALSQDDIQRLCDTRVVTYPQLADAHSIDQLLYPYNSFVVLILLKNEDYGHWVCVLRQSPTRLLFFDSYGIVPDNEFKWISQKKRVSLGEAEDSLTRLFDQAKHDGYTVEYNEYALQKKNKTVNTCGRWCVMRIWDRDASVREFATDYDDDNVTYYTDAVMQQLGGYSR